MRRGYLLAVYLLLAAVAAIQQWSIEDPGDPYTHYNNYVIFRQAFAHLVGQQDLYVQYLAEHWDYFRYSPTFALAFGAFAWMPDVAGLLLWNLLNAAVLFAAWATLPVRHERVALAAGWFVAVELMTALQNTQSNALIAGLVILAFNSLERRQIARGTLLIALACYVKLFALVAFSLCLLFPEKRKSVLVSAGWMTLLAMLPLLVVSPSQLARLYASWWALLSMDFAESAGLSVMGWLQAWFGVMPPKRLVVLLGAAAFCLPLALGRRERDAGFRLLVLANVLIWVVIFNHKAESSTYVLAVCGVALWFFTQPATPLHVALAVAVFVFTSLSPTDVFPSAIDQAVIVPYAVKAVPCLLVWVKLTFDLLTPARGAPSVP